VSGSRLSDRVALVTGSSRGLGAAVVRAMAEEGARVVVHCRRENGLAAGVASEIREAGGEVLLIHGDVCSFEDARTVVERAVDHFGRLDVLVNTVGDFQWRGLIDLEPAEWRSVLASNLDSVFHMCRLAVPHMRERRFGRIVNFAAVGAAQAQGEPETGAYSAAKAGVVALSRALALEEARAGITVNVVAPGLLRGEPNGTLERETPVDAALGDRVPVGHAGCAADVVRTVLFLTSPAAEFVTGQVIEVAGGARA